MTNSTDLYQHTLAYTRNKILQWSIETKYFSDLYDCGYNTTWCGDLSLSHDVPDTVTFTEHREVMLTNNCSIHRNWAK